MCKYLFKFLLSVLLGIYPDVELLDPILFQQFCPGSSHVAQWVKDLALSLDHCCGLGSIPGPGISACQGCSQKQKKKKKRKFCLIGILFPQWLHHFIFPTVHRVLISPHSHQRLLSVFVCLFDNGYLMGMTRYVILVLHFPDN